MPPQPIPIVVIPTHVGNLVVPSTTVCEVVSSVSLRPVPGSRDWVLGYCIWRGAPVSVVSFERLAGSPLPDTPVRRIVVMYPLSGRDTHEFFALAASAEPRGSRLDPDNAPPSVPPPPRMPRGFVADAIEVNHEAAAIPDFDALKAAFYG